MKKLKSTKLFLWLNKGTKLQVFIKRLLAFALLMCAFYWAGYGMGTLLGLMT